MIQRFSSLNIFLAIIYMLIYLKSGTFNSTMGIFMIIIFNWLALRSFQWDDYSWKIWHYCIALWSLYFIGTLVYGGANILSASIEYDYISNDTLTYLIINFVFCALVTVHLMLYAYKNYKQMKI